MTNTLFNMHNFVYQGYIPLFEPQDRDFTVFLNTKNIFVTKLLRKKIEILTYYYNYCLTRNTRLY